MGQLAEHALTSLLCAGAGPGETGAAVGSGTGKRTYGKSQAYAIARDAKADLELRFQNMEEEQKSAMLAFVFKQFPAGVKAAAESLGMFHQAQQDIIDQIEDQWTADLGSAIRSVCKLSIYAYQRLIQLLCQVRTTVNGKLRYLPKILACGLKFPQLCANASVRKVHSIRKAMAREFNITTTHLSELLDGTSQAPGKCKKSHKKASQISCRRPVGDVVSERIQEYAKAGRIDLNEPIKVLYLSQIHPFEGHVVAGQPWRKPIILC